MEEWHQLTMQIFKDTYWQTRDQGTLIATVWKHGLQNHPMLPQKFNFIADVNNAYLCFSPLEGYALKPELPKTEPILLHLFHSDLHNPNWSLKTHVEQILVKRTFQTAPKRQKQISQHWLSEHFRQHGFIKGLSPLVKRILIEMALKKKKLYP